MTISFVFPTSFPRSWGRASGRPLGSWGAVSGQPLPPLAPGPPQPAREGELQALGRQEEVQPALVTHPSESAGCSGVQRLVSARWIEAVEGVLDGRQRAR